MRRFAFTILTLFIAAQSVFANGYQTLHEALVKFGEGKYTRAKELFIACQSASEFANDATAKHNIEIKINLCISRIQEQQRNAQAAERARLERLKKREAEKKVYISINATDSKDTWPSGTESILFELLRKHKRSFTSNIEEALSYVTVNVITKEEKRDEHFIIDTYGTIRFGNAINPNQFDFNWTTPQACRSISYESFDDAKNRSYQELNQQLASALDCFLNGMPVPQKEIKANNNIAVSIVTRDGILEKNLSEFLDAVNFYLDADDTYTLKSTTNPSVQAVFKELYRHQVDWTAVDQRAEIAKQDGITYILYIEVKKGNEGNYTFIGNIMNMKGNSVKSSKPLSIRVNQLTKSYQELAAAMMCESLGVKEWIIGEELCGGQLLRAPQEKGVRRPGLICYVLKPTYDKWFHLHNTSSITSRNMSYHGMIEAFDPGNSSYWRYPHIEEVGLMAKYMDALGLRGLYWTGDNDQKMKPIACEIKNYISTERPKCSKAATVIVREF